MAASSSMNATLATAAFRAKAPRGHARHTSTSTTSTSGSAIPLVTRCPNSIIVFSDGSRGMSSPLQSGQWSPQPAPAPDARTNPPQRMTRTV